MIHSYNFEARRIQNTEFEQIALSELKENDLITTKSLKAFLVSKELKSTSAIFIQDCDNYYLIYENADDKFCMLHIVADLVYCNDVHDTYKSALDRAHEILTVNNELYDY